MPAVLSLLDEAKLVFKAAYREMLILLGEDRPVALMVDEVISVEELQGGSPLDYLGTNHSGLILNTMRSQKTANPVFLLDDAQIMCQYKHNSQTVEESREHVNEH